MNSQHRYLNSLIHETEKAVKRTKAFISRRHKTREYYLIKNYERIQVCQKFFLAILDISDTVIKNLLKKRDEHNVLEDDRRGKHSPSVKRPQCNREFTIEHINSFPRIPFHYIRKDTKKEYLDLISPKSMTFYLQKCKEENVSAEKIFYRNIFHNNFNLLFHTPSKDRCDKCYMYDKMDSDQKLLYQEDYHKHLANKEPARTNRNIFKQKAENGDCKFVEFDFEAVRYCPSLQAKAVFYKRQLSVYNLTVYDVKSRKATNHMCHEGLLEKVLLK